MTRRQLIPTTCVVVVGLGAACWIFTDRLTVEERRLVDKWETDSHPGEGVYRYWTFRRDQTLTIEGWPGMGPPIECHWSVRDGVILADAEPHAARRTLRPLLEWLGVHVGPVWPWEIKTQTADRMTFQDGSSPRIWDRVPAD